MLEKVKFVLLATVALLFVSCSGQEEKPTAEEPVDPVGWAKNAVMYEVNTRQHTPEGTFKAFQEDLPRLKELGIDILWFMPIHPVGEERRKGEMGSYYSVKDYTGINPDHGTKEDFKDLVDKAHEMGFKVIIDWVANHSAFDNPWAKDHPDWYTQDSTGAIIHPATTDWTDVADLNYDNPDMRRAMIEALKYWVKEFDIDGYRCDVAGFVPVDFWMDARAALDSIKPVFMLAEWEDPEYHKAFHMTYGWEFHHITNEIAKGKMNAQNLVEFYTKDTTRFPSDAYRLNFATNHDENSWNGTLFERYGDGADAMSALVFVFKGMPLMYSGQEASMKKRLRFFTKDTIDWSDKSRVPFYTTLIDLHHNNKALENGPYSAPIKFHETGNPNVLVMEQKKREGLVFSMFNLNDETATFKLEGLPAQGYELRSVFDGSKVTLKPDQEIKMSSWEYFILTP